MDSSPYRKARKQYTIHKVRENWTEEEHQKFLEALKLYERDWKKIEKFIGTKSVIQIRSHAQKYFLKVQKNKTGERIPPPRPKRKSTQSFTPKKQESLCIPWVSTSESMSINPALNSPSAFVQWMQSTGLMSGSSGNINQSIESQRKQQEQIHQAQNFLQQAMLSSLQNQTQAPNYTKIYSVLGSLFDSTINHSELFDTLSTVDKDMIHSLMYSLSVEFSPSDQHTFLLEQYRNIVQKHFDKSKMI